MAESKVYHTDKLTKVANENMTRPQPPTIAFFGKLGHGKTRALNLLCGTEFCSLVQAKSCTTELQFGTSLKYGIQVIDTPGFYSSEDTVNHTMYQKQALQMHPLSGIYVVVKFGRADEMSETVSKVMNFVGNDDVRIIVTHIDTIPTDAQGQAILESKQSLFDLLEVVQCNIVFVGENSSCGDLEEFVFGTLHDPREFAVAPEQLIYVSTLCVGARKFHEDVATICAKLEAAGLAVDNLETLPKESFADEKLWERLTKTVRRKILSYAVSMMRQEETHILQKAKELTPEQQKALRTKIKEAFGKSGKSLKRSCKKLTRETVNAGSVLDELSISFLPTSSGYEIVYVALDQQWNQYNLPELIGRCCDIDQTSVAFVQPSEEKCISVDDSCHTSPVKTLDNDECMYPKKRSSRNDEISTVANRKNSSTIDRDASVISTERNYEQTKKLCVPLAVDGLNIPPCMEGKRASRTAQLVHGGLEPNRDTKTSTISKKSPLLKIPAFPSPSWIQMRNRTSGRPSYNTLSSNESGSAANTKRVDYTSLNQWKPRVRVAKKRRYDNTDEAETTLCGCGCLPFIRQFFLRCRISDRTFMETSAESVCMLDGADVTSYGTGPSRRPKKRR